MLSAMDMYFKTARVVCVAIACGFFLASGVVAQEKRIALVIGNGGYDSLPVLNNPVRDAEAISQSLSALGYTVFLTTELDQEKFRKAIRFFKSRAADADTTLLYFAGHGATLGGRSYLFPTDFGKSDIYNLNEAIDLEQVLDGLGSNLRSSLVFIDACRDNPLQSGGIGIDRLFDSGQDLRAKARIGTLISFATTPGHIAYDGGGAHSPFTGALLDHLETPGIDVELMLKRVRRDVVVNTQGQQVPWTESSLLSTFQLAPRSVGFVAKRRQPDEPANINPSLLSVLSTTGFSQKPVLQRFSTGFSSGDSTFLQGTPPDRIANSQRSERIKSLLCTVLEPPLPPSCSGFTQ